MAFTLEDGSGVEGANAYRTSGQVLAYLTDRGRESEWAGSGDALNAAIIKATDYVEKRFRSRWTGERVSEAQGLSFPRTGVEVDGAVLASDVLPTPLVQAVSEYAPRALSATLLPDPAVAAAGSSGIVQRVRRKVGPIDTDTTYAVTEGQTVSTIREYPAADLLLEPLLTGIGLTGTLGRF